jgi:hypothetical protein
MITRNRGQKRLRLRVASGKFTGSTLANTFGLRAPVCPHCRSFNPHDVGSPQPTECQNCKKTIAPDEWV